MKRFTVFGLCVVTGFTLSVLVASSAQAKKTEHGELNLAYAGGAGHLSSETGSITFTSGAGRADIGSQSGGMTAIELFGVEATGSKCHSAGKPEGTVESELLSLGTGWISKAKGEAGMDFKPASGIYVFQFDCGPLIFKIKGSVIGHVAPINHPSKSLTLNFDPDELKKANSPHSFEGGSPEILETNRNGVETGETLLEWENVSVPNEGNSSVCKVKHGVAHCSPGQYEFGTLLGAPGFGRCDKQKGGQFQEANCATLAAPGKGKFAFVPAGS